MFINRSLIVFLLVGVLSLVPVAQAQNKGLVGISMPTKYSERWIHDGANMVKSLKELGYTTELVYAEDDIPNQLAQIENLVTKGAKALVVASIDGTTLNEAFRVASAKGVKIIAYDRLIMNVKNVDYYATFDNFQVGVIQGTSLIDALKLKDGKGPFNIELFGGSPDDNNAFFFYNGAMSVLKPYIDSGKLVVRSKETTMDKIGTIRWDGDVAKARMAKLLSAYYAKDKVHAVLAPYDGLSRGILSSLKDIGYCTPQQPCPFVSGQDAEVPSVKSIIRGEQYSTVFKDTRELAKVTAKMVDSILSGKEPETNDIKTYNNGSKIIPSYLLKPVLVDRSNYKAVLVDSGYVTEEKLSSSSSAADSVVVATSAAPVISSDKKISLGFAQVGAESEWRAANTVSIKESAKTAGIDLKFSEAQQKQENQIKAIRSYIAQNVNVIAFAPVVTTGWDTVLKEAKAAKIPVILTDRGIETSDESLYVTMIGSDFTEEGRKAAKWLLDNYKATGDVNIVELQGTVGSAPAIERKKGFQEVIKAQPRFKITRSQTGDFTRAKGREVMEAFLKADPSINVLYAHNDDMAIGAIQAIEAAGKKPGKDIIIIGVDAVKGAFEAMVAGKMNVTVECNPQLGPQLMEVVKKVAAGEKVERRIMTKEGVFPMETAAREFPNRKY